MRRSQQRRLRFFIAKHRYCCAADKIGLLLGYRRDSALRRKNTSAAKYLPEIVFVGHVLCRDFLNSAEMTDVGIDQCSRDPSLHATRTLVETGSMHMPCNEGYRTLVPH